MPQETVTSRDNPQVKRLAALLGRKKERDESGLFAAEGLRLCQDALESGLRPRVLYLTPQSAQRYPQSQQLVQAAGQVVWLEQSLAARIGDTKTPQGIFSILEKLDNRQTAVTIKGGGRYLALAGLQDPGNLGSALRTADALGIDGVLLSADCPDLYSPKVLRAAMGGLFRLPAAVWPDMGAAVAALRRAVPVYAAALTPEALTIRQADFSGGGAVLIGNEGAGLPPQLTAACTAAVSIPMRAGANSLNAAVAAAILMWEMRG